MVTGSADMISGRVADPTGDRIDAIHVYRDLNGNGVIDLGIDELLHADTRPADWYAFDAGSLPSGRHVLHVAAMKAGAVVGSFTTTLAAARDPSPVFVPVLMRELGNSPRGVSEGGA